MHSYTMLVFSHFNVLRIFCQIGSIKMVINTCYFERVEKVRVASVQRHARCENYKIVIGSSRLFPRFRVKG